MKSNRFAAALIIALLLSQFSLAQTTDWAHWRGPTKNGIAPTGQKPATKWSDDTKFIWKVKVPGRGHASPTIVGDHIFLATADERNKKQQVVCYSRKTGEQKWLTTVSEGAFAGKIHPKNTFASQTIATDGERVFAVFENHGSIQVTALDFKGEKVWQKIVGKYQPKFQFGYGTSPIMHGKNVIVTSDNQADSRIVAYDGKTGDEVWTINRHKRSSYSPPVIAKTGGREQMLISGGQKIFSYDPKDGSQLWEANASWQVSCGTMVWNDDLVFTSGGFPSSQTLAIDSTNGQIKWQNRVKCYEQSLVLHENHLYGVNEQGALYCWDAESGDQKWVERLKGGNPQSASPVVANGNIYVTSELGTTHVVRADPSAFQLVATNQLGTEQFASMTMVDSLIFARAATGRGAQRQEYLYCIPNEQAQ